MFLKRILLFTVVFLAGMRAVLGAVPTVSAVTPLNVTAREGHVVTLTCDAVGDPKPEISWSKTGSVTKEDVAGPITRSTLSLTPDPSQGNTQLVICTAFNPAGSTMVTFTLTMLYPPTSPPVISGVPAGGVVYKGDDVSLICSVIGGSPPVSSVTLTCPRYRNTSQGDVSSLHFTAGGRDQGSCFCSAFHVEGYSLTDSLVLDVQEASCNIALHVGSSVGGSSVFYVIICFIIWKWCK